MLRPLHRGGWGKVVVLARPGGVRGLGLRGRRARWRGTDRPHRLPQRAAVGAGDHRRGVVVRARAGRSRTSHDQVGSGRGDAVRRAEPLLGCRHQRVRDRRAAGSDGDAAGPGNRGEVGAGVAERLRPPDPGRHLAHRRRRRSDAPAPATRGRRSDRRGRASPAGAPRRPAAGSAPAPGAPRPGPHPRRGTALRRAGRPGRPGAEVGRAPRRARRPSRGTAGPLRGDQSLSRASHRDPGRRAKPPRARPPRRRPATSGGLDGQPATRAHDRRSLPGSCRCGALRAGGRGASGDRDAVGPVPRDLPEAAGRRGPGASVAVRCGGKRDAGHHRHPRLGTTSGAGRGRALLLLHGGGAERRQALRAGTVSVRVDEDPYRWRLAVTDDGTGFDQTHAAAASGVGLANMRDRLDAVGGTVEVFDRRDTRRHASPAGAPRRPAAGRAPAPGAPRSGPHPRRGAALRRAGRPGRPGAEVGRAPSRARRPSRGAAGPLRGASRPLESVSSRPRTPSEAASSATSTTAPSNIWWP